MNKITSIITTLIILSTFTFFVAISASGQVASVPAPPAPAVDISPDNFTKLEISPRYANFRLQPGESKEITITIKNKEKNTVIVKPGVIITPYSEYIMDETWVTFTPESAEISAGETQKITLKASLPEDAKSGYYNTQITFTDEAIPAPYQAFPSYVHTISLSIEVWMPPKIQIMTPYISDQLEAGSEYDYEIKLKNTGNEAIGISPELGSDTYYGTPYSMIAPALTGDSITITSPQSIPADATENIKIHIKVPADAKGYYNGYIHLGIDDPSVREWEGMVTLNFNIWKQPAEAFVKSFTLKEAAPITIEISSSYYYAFPYAKATGEAKEPSFETSLAGPAGEAELNATRTVIKGSVNMGGDRPPWEIDSESIYQEMGVQYIVIYKTDGSPGEWNLKILPRNTQGFEYSITIGG